MGYVLNALGNLPVDGTVRSYIFVLKPTYNDELTDAVERNFREIAREIGNNAIIAAGLDEKRWLEEVGPTYLGQDWPAYQELLPALLITDSHPDDVANDSKRIFIPLAEVPKRYPTWTAFFRLLVQHVRGESNELLNLLQPKKDAFTVIDGILKIKPGIFGINIDFNALAGAARDQLKEGKKPPLVR